MWVPVRGCVDETYYLIRVVDLATIVLRHCTQTGLAVVVDRLFLPVVVWEEDVSIAADHRLATMLTIHWRDSGSNFATSLAIPNTHILTRRC